MNHHARILRSLLLAAALGTASLTGCADDRNSIDPVSPSAPATSDAVIAIGHDDATLTYDVRLQEIRELASAGEVSATIDALDGLFAELGSAAEAGTVSEAQVMDYASTAQSLVEKIDIDVHFGTDEKCDATFNCVDGTQMCVSVTWRIKGVGGGRNCYNFTVGS